MGSGEHCKLSNGVSGKAAINFSAFYASWDYRLQTRVPLCETRFSVSGSPYWDFWVPVLVLEFTSFSQYFMLVQTTDESV